MPSPNPAGPRPWLLAAPVPHGPWRLLLYYWTYGPHWRAGDELPRHGEVIVWPKRKTCAADLGVPYNTIKTWHRWLAESGWVRRLDDGISLAVGAPCDEWIAQPGSSQTRVQSDPGLAKPAPGSEQTRPPGLAKPAPGSEQTRPSKPASEPASGTCQGTDQAGEAEGQAEFALAADQPSDLDRLRAEHDRLRREALAAAGQRRTALPKPASKAGRALDTRARKALAAHGLPKCLEVLAWQAKRWHEDPGQLAYSTSAVWSPGSLRYALERMGRSGPVGLVRGGSWQAPANPEGDHRGPVDADTDSVLGLGYG